MTIVNSVRDASEVGEARRAAAGLARRKGLAQDVEARIALVVTEMATNLLKHAGEGLVAITEFVDIDGSGIELLALDKGPGMADVARCLVDGFSTVGSPGTGLGAIARVSDSYAIYSRPVTGTAVMARFVAASGVLPGVSEIGVVIDTYPGESICGDGWATANGRRGASLLLVDGSGHGPHAAHAAETAARAFADNIDKECVPLVEAIHRALAPTRGAALAVARIDTDAQVVRFVGVGNIGAVLAAGGEARRMACYNGTAGHVAPRIREFTYPFTSRPLVILHSDGLSARWEIDAYPGLAASHSSLVAGMLFRHHRRGRDDATPLNSVLALSRLLLARIDGDLTLEQEKQVQFIRKAAESLTELVNDLLDLAKVEAGKTVVTPVEFTAEDLFGALRGMLRPLLAGDSVALIFEDAEELPLLHTDEGKVSQILRNFLSNAIKFTERGEVRVWGTADPDADTVIFHVRDTGIGIAEQDLGVIFEEFGQVAHPMQSRVKGTGLGLPLSKRLAELLGGAIAVQSAGQGSVFSVTVPRVYRAAEPVELGEEDWAVDPSRIPVLLVDDDLADAFAMQRLLSGTRYQPIFAHTVATAKRALGHVQPAAVLLDVVLAGDESWRLILGLRQGEATGNIPIVVTSSTGEERKALHLGADAYLQKPIDHQKLLGILDRVTGNRSTTRVLLVDDEEVTRYLVRQLLPRGVYDVREAKSGTEGFLQLLSQPPDVLLLDLKMPEMTGFELLDRISGEPRLDGIAAIVLTSAILNPVERQRLRRAARIMSKSDLSGSALTGAITDVLGGARSESA